MVPARRQATSSVAKQVAASLDAPLAALPLLGELFADLWALGSAPRRIANWLHVAGLRRSHRVLDLGCGKGAVAVGLARRFGCRVLGVDALPPFIASARESAKRHGVAELCRFEVADASRFVRRLRAGRLRAKGRALWDQAHFDVSMMVSLWPAERAARALAPLTRPGGLIVIDDAVSIESARRRGLPPTAAHMRVVFASLGLQVLREHVSTRSETARRDVSLYSRIAARGRRIARRDPRSRAIIAMCLRRQREAIRVLAGPLRPAMWLLRHNSSSRVP